MLVLCLIEIRFYSGEKEKSWKMFRFNSPIEMLTYFDRHNVKLSKYYPSHGERIW